MMRLIIALIFLTISTFSYGAVPTVEVGEWYEISGSNVSAVQPNPYTGLGVAASLMDSWNGATYDQARNRLVVFGGGHSNSGDNSIYYFDLNTQTWGTSFDVAGADGYYYPDYSYFPSLNYSSNQGTNTDSDPYPDGSPIVWHTYGGPVFVPDEDSMYVVGSSTVWRYDGDVDGVDPKRGAWYNFTTDTWDVDPTVEANRPYGTFARADYDPVLDRIFVASNSSGMASMSVSTGAWVLHSSESAWYNAVRPTGVIDPVKRNFVQLAYNLVSYSPLVASGDMPNVVATTSGDAPTGLSDTSGGAMGAMWDPVLKEIVVYDGGINLYSLDTSTDGTVGDPWVWTEWAPTDGTSASESGLTLEGNMHGVFGRFQYDEENNVYIVVNGTTKNVWLTRLTQDRASELSMGGNSNLSVGGGSTLTFN